MYRRSKVINGRIEKEIQVTNKNRVKQIKYKGKNIHIELQQNKRNMHRHGQIPDLVYDIGWQNMVLWRANLQFDIGYFRFMT